MSKYNDNDDDDDDEIEFVAQTELDIIKETSHSKVKNVTTITSHFIA